MCSDEKLTYREKYFEGNYFQINNLFLLFSYNIKEQKNIKIHKKINGINKLSKFKNNFYF